MTVVPFCKEHIDDIARLENECFSTPWSKQALTDELENPNANFLTAFDGEKLVGYLGLYDISGECYITNIAVFPEFRRMGVADMLLSRGESEAVKRGCIFISLEVRQSNSPAIDLYKKHGYEIAGVRKNFYSRPAEDAYIMTKILRTDPA
ncbi:MAG: ribosomal protein S18-alanine N-acetyltransferase [Clostridiales bacterium]|nr:ribosomal protein S18-alanine N-acetyltransferase [Clostridiales bacterium]